MFARLLWIAAAGACGTLARYGLSGLGDRWTPAGLPAGTLAVNLGGCLMFGCLAALAEHRAGLGPETRLVITVGFLGAFTTFSTFAFESAQFLQDAKLGLALLYVVVQNAVGVLAILGGAALGNRAFAPA